MKTILTSIFISILLVGCGSSDNGDSQQPKKRTESKKELSLTKKFQQLIINKASTNSLAIYFDKIDDGEETSHKIYSPSFTFNEAGITLSHQIIKEGEIEKTVMTPHPSGYGGTLKYTYDSIFESHLDSSNTNISYEEDVTPNQINIYEGNLKIALAQYDEGSNEFSIKYLPSILELIPEEFNESGELLEEISLHQSTTINKE